MSEARVGRPGPGSGPRAGPPRRRADWRELGNRGSCGGTISRVARDVAGSIVAKRTRASCRRRDGAGLGPGETLSDLDQMARLSRAAEPAGASARRPVGGAEGGTEDGELVHR